MWTCMVCGDTFEDEDLAVQHMEYFPGHIPMKVESIKIKVIKR